MSIAETRKVRTLKEKKILHAKKRIPTPPFPEKGKMLNRVITFVVIL